MMTFAVNFLLCCAAGTMHDGTASPDRAETGSPRDNQSAPGCSEQPQEAPIQVNLNAVEKHVHCLWRVFFGSTTRESSKFQILQKYK